MAELIDKGTLYDAMTEEYLKHYAGDVASSFTIAMQMVQNQPTVTEAEIRNRAIDEFAECLSLGISESLIWGMLPVDCKEGVSDEIVEYVLNAIKVVADQLKEET